MQSKYETEKANETVNLVNGEKNMFVNKKDAMKFNQEELIAIQEFNEKLKCLVKEYESRLKESYHVSSWEIKHEFSIENENLVKIFVPDVISEIYLRENEDENQREFCIKTYDLFCESEIYSEGIVCREIIKALDIVLEHYDEYLSGYCAGIAIGVDMDYFEKGEKRNKIDVFDQIDLEYIYKYAEEFARYINQYKFISKDSLEGLVHEKKLGFMFTRFPNVLIIKIFNPSFISLTLKVDRINSCNRKIYILQHNYKLKDKFDKFNSIYDDGEIICYKKIEEALKQMFSLLKSDINKVLELENCVVKKLEHDESVSNDF